MKNEQVYPYKLLPKYPGLRPRDEIIWDSYIESHPGVFKACYYNVKVGDPVEHEALRKGMLASGLYDVARWNVDIIAWDGTRIYVIEVKPDAMAGALGQAIAYRALLMQEGRLNVTAIPAVLTDNPSTILLQAAHLMGVEIMIP